MKIVGFLIVLLGALVYAEDKSSFNTGKSPVVLAKSASEKNSDGESFKFACVAKFSTKNDRNEIIKKCSELLNSLKKNEFGIVPFSVEEIKDFPKIKKGMSKRELLSKFGKPDHVSDDGEVILYRNKVFCGNSGSYCKVFFWKDIKYKYTGVSSWSDFKYEYTDNLED